MTVRIRPEPLNPIDPSAIAIDVDYGTGWAHVGYIALTDVFDINNSKYVQQVIDVHLVQLANFLDFFPSIF